MPESVFCDGHQGHSPTWIGERRIAGSVRRLALTLCGVTRPTLRCRMCRPPSLSSLCFDNRGYKTDRSRRRIQRTILAVSFPGHIVRIGVSLVQFLPPHDTAFRETPRALQRNLNNTRQAYRKGSIETYLHISDILQSPSRPSNSRYCIHRLGYSHHRNFSGTSGHRTQHRNRYTSCSPTARRVLSRGESASLGVWVGILNKRGSP